MERRRRVYFVGAGLSAGFGYPVGAQLLPNLVRYLQTALRGDGARAWKAPETRRRTHQLLEALADTVKRYFGVDLENIGGLDVASFYSVVHMLAENPWFPSNHRIEDVREHEATTTLYYDLAAATRGYFNEIYESASSVGDVASFTKDLRWASDVVVTFNWDEQLDEALTALHNHEEVGYTLGAGENKMAVPLLKPHGSIGWYDVQQGIRNDSTYFIAEHDERVPRSKCRLVSYLKFEPPIDMDGNAHPILNCPPMIAPPTFAKRFNYFEQQQVWQDVVTATRRADDIIFLGYAMPKDDFLTRAAISAALHDREQSGQRELRCLVVDLKFDRNRGREMKQLFGRKFSDSKNYMPWRFGSKSKQFASKLSRALESARV